MRDRTKVIAATAVIAVLAAGSTTAAMAATTGTKPAAPAAAVSATKKPAPGTDQGGSKSPAPRPASVKTRGAHPAGQPGDAALTAAAASYLHRSTAQVSAALQPLYAAGDADPSSPSFAAAARALGVSTQQLSDALVYAKRSLAPEAGGKAGDKKS